MHPVRRRSARGVARAFALATRWVHDRPFPRGGWRWRRKSLNMPAGGSLHPTTRNRGGEDALRPPGRAGGVRRSQFARAAEAAEKVLTRNGVTGADLSCFIPHQANKRIILSTRRERLLGMPEDAVDHQHRPVWEHNRSNDSAGDADRAREWAFEEGRPGAAGQRRCRIHGRCDIAAVEF